MRAASHLARNWRASASIAVSGLRATNVGGVDQGFLEFCGIECDWPEPVPVPKAVDIWACRHPDGARILSIRSIMPKNLLDASVLDADTLQDPIVAAGRMWKLIPLTIEHS
jgi:hypothetical protein